MVCRTPSKKRMIVVLIMQVTNLLHKLDPFLVNVVTAVHAGSPVKSNIKLRAK